MSNTSTHHNLHYPYSALVRIDCCRELVVAFDLHIRPVQTLVVGTCCHSLVHMGFQLVARTGCPHLEHMGFQLGARIGCPYLEHMGLPLIDRKDSAGRSRLDSHSVRTVAKSLSAEGMVFELPSPAIAGHRASTRG